MIVVVVGVVVAAPCMLLHHASRERNRLLRNRVYRPKCISNVAEPMYIGRIHGARGLLAGTHPVGTMLLAEEACLQRGMTLSA